MNKPNYEAIIVETGDGRFQVRKDHAEGDVLHPGKYRWEGSYQSSHEFMFFPAEHIAIRELKKTIQKETSVSLKRISFVVDDE